MTRNRSLIVTGVILGVLLLAPGGAFACPVCFQNVESPLLDAARAGVLAMAGVTLCVLGAFGAWFLRLRRLSRYHEDRSATGRAGEPT